MCVCWSGGSTSTFSELFSAMNKTSGRGRGRGEGEGEGEGEGRGGEGRGGEGEGGREGGRVTDCYTYSNIIQCHHSI